MKYQKNEGNDLNIFQYSHIHVKASRNKQVFVKEHDCIETVSDGQMMFCRCQDHQERIQGTSELVQNPKILQRKKWFIQKLKNSENPTSHIFPTLPTLRTPTLCTPTLRGGGSTEPPRGTRYGRIGGRPYT